MRLQDRADRLESMTGSWGLSRADQIAGEAGQSRLAGLAGGWWSAEQASWLSSSSSWSARLPVASEAGRQTSKQ